MRFAIAADHNGLALKQHLITWLGERGHEAEDRGAHGPDTVDYPPLCADVCSRVLAGAAGFGIVVGGSGSGEQMACNKIRGIRAALCDSVFLARIARGHNDANVLVLGAKVIDELVAEQILAGWLETAFKGGRHQHRLDQIAALERGESLS
ncbi:ribose 5-phosphate isomerase B [Amycolatopsis acidiphila]|uniref:ribose 5-phosphate isomerase B n=1 Tax=Amycolatopsis acidiphila TaxID=715473 RepID=UPI0016437262|nr:ribose 5-phosphate isomerase B [Amycolatopsis acidiphila]UIJ57084.1 ribose 5-phosphate isomerase B [Amycolatopsis acidiphila]GHG53451.1 ribose 5-phosphate isomerase B [Amycolatopsis acidiphila]